MSRNEQMVLPYEANDHHQLLIDTIKLRNRTLLHFLLDLKKEAPRLTANEIGMGLLSNYQKRFIAMFDANLIAAFSNFVRQAASQLTTDTAASWEQQTQAFLYSLHTIKQETLEERADPIKNERPRLEGSDQPDLLAKTPFLMDERSCDANYTEIMAHYDRKLTEVLNANVTAFQAILAKGKKSATSAKIRDHINRQQAAKDELVSHLEKDMDFLVAQQTAAQIRESAMTAALHSTFGDNIPERLLATPDEQRVTLVLTGIALHTMPTDKREAVMLEINRQDTDGNTLAHVTVPTGDLKLTKWLIDQGTDWTLLNVNKVRALDQVITTTGMTLLERALHDEDLIAFNKYLKAGIDPMVENAQAEKQTILNVLYAIGSNGNGNPAARKEKEVVHGFLSAFLDYFAERKAINLWSTEIVAVQRFILQTREEPLDHRAFEKKLEELKWKIIHYLQDVLLERVEDNWLVEKPLFTWESSYKHFKMRWDHCNELLLAMRQSVKECNPKILDAVIQKQKEDLDANPGMTGPFRQSRLHRSTSEVVLRQQTDMELFIQKRDEHRLVRAAEAQKQLEWDNMKLQINNLTTQLAESQTTNQTLSTQVTTLTTQVTELTNSNQTMSVQIAALTQMVGMLLAERGLTVPNQPMTNQVSPIVNTSSPSPAANPQSLFAGSPPTAASTAATIPVDAAQEDLVVNQTEEAYTL